MQCLHQCFSQAAARTPDALAVVDDHGGITFAELDSRSDALAALLQAHGVGLDDTVGIHLRKSVDYIVACLAALKAGGAFLPLFLDYPPSLSARVLEQTKTKVVLTTSEFSQALPAQAVTRVVELDRLGEQSSGYPLSHRETTPENLMFVVYTSGTTGEPKGIQLPHRAALHSYLERYKISDYEPGQPVACNIFFVWEFFRSLIRGATVYVISDDIIYDPKLLSRYLASHKIEEVLFTPSLMETMLLHLPPEAWADELASLKVIWLNGEVVTERLRQAALEVLPKQVRLLNTYSISECHDVASLDLRAATPSPTGFCRVGYPIDGITVRLMNPEGQPVPTGEEGEIYVGGPGLARGYLGKPHLTAQRFVTYQGERLYRTGDFGYQYPDGLLEIRGRCDSMVKIRGYSVHLGAVQSALEQLESVAGAAVVAIGQEGKDKRLVAYVVGDQEKTWKVDPVTGACPELRDVLRQTLAEFMLPNLFVECESLPLNPTTGKLDLKALPAPPQRRSYSTEDLSLPPDAGIEEKQRLVATIWERILGLDPGVVNPRSNFFDLGGHSLMAVRVTQHIERIMGCSLTVKQLYEYPNVKQLTQFLHSPNEQPVTKAAGPQPEDWALPPEVSPPSGLKKVKLSQAKGVFFTGGTGFLGAFLLHQLGQSSDCPIYCLVRPGSDNTPVTKRLRETLEGYGLTFTSRMRAVSGDLSKPELALSPDDLETVKNETDLVFHCAAAVNYVHNYEVLKPHTVGGTLEVLKMCTSGRPKTLHYISTNGVFPGGDTYLENSDIDPYLEGLGNGYGHSKWVAEKLVWQASRRGVPVTLYRPGNIGHHSTTGQANKNDFQYLLMKGCFQTGLAPKAPSWFFEMTPVDFIAELITKVADSEDHAGKVFHLVQTPTTPAQPVFEALQKEGFVDNIVPLEEWLEAVRATAKKQEDSKLEVLANSLKEVEGYLTDSSSYDNRQLQQLLKTESLNEPQAGYSYLKLLLEQFQPSKAGKP